MFENLASTSWYKLNFGLFALMALATISATVVFETNARQRSLAAVQESITDKARSLRATLESNIHAKINTVESIATVISIESSLPQNKYAELVEQIMQTETNIRNIAIAPDFVVNFVYPSKGNDATMGMDFRKSDDLKSALEYMEKGGGSLLAGPISFVQGGQGFIVRAPVSVFDPETGKKRLWGVVSGAIDAKQFYQESGLLAPENELDIALRNSSDTGVNPPFFGDQAVFDNAPIIENVMLHNGIWELAITPKGGWLNYRGSFVVARYLFVLGGILFLGLLFFASRQAQNKQQAESILGTALEAIEDGFALYDPNDKLVAFNSKYVDIYRLSKKSITVGNSFKNILLEGVKNGQYTAAMGQEKEWIAQRLKSHRAADTTIEQELKHGKWLRISERKTPDGSIVGVRVDITELKQAKQAADAANRAKSVFLNVISHELRTPLTVVLGYLPMLTNSEKLTSVQTLIKALKSGDISTSDLQDDLQAILTEIKQIADNIDASGQHLLSLINDLLDMSFVESGKMPLHITSLDVSQLMTSIRDQFQQAATHKGLTLTCDSQGGHILADNTRMRQMLINLVGNAIKFTATGNIDLSTKINGKYVEFNVKDMGEGIPHSDIDKIFEYFIQSDNSASRRAEGTGLGLAITKKLALLHGGDISVISTKGKGSTFTLRIPKDQNKGGDNGVNIGG